MHNINNDDSLAADDHRIETYTLDDICRHDETGVTPNGLILVALLAGGDYHPVCLRSLLIFYLTRIRLVYKVAEQRMHLVLQGQALVIS